MTLREGDIESLRRKQALEGRPIKSGMIRDGSKQVFFEKKEKGKVRITDVLETE